jgi:hypothetical protein
MMASEIHASIGRTSARSYRNRGYVEPGRQRKRDLGGPRSEECQGLIDDASTAVARLSEAGFVCPVVTIQSRIGKGIFSIEEFQEWFRSFADPFCELGVRSVGPYIFIQYGEGFSVTR